MKFIRILTLELDDLTEDIEQLMALDKSRCEKGEISNYVYLENTSLLKNEISCLSSLGKFVASVDPEGFETVSALLDHITGGFRTLRKEGCYSPAIESMVLRKLQKVFTFVES